VRHGVNPYLLGDAKAHELIRNTQSLKLLTNREGEAKTKHAVYRENR
jgi:hypothetical protein